MVCGYRSLVLVEGRWPINGTSLRNALVFMIVALAIFWATKKQVRPSDQPSAKARETYLGLRDLIFRESRTKLSLPPTTAPNEPWGVVMDWGMGSGTVTVLALSDGSASIYLSSGGGSLGGIGQEPIRNAAKKAVTLAAEVQSQMKPVSAFPLPATGQVQFYVLTDAGVYAAGASESDLQTGRSPFSKLGDGMQGVITEYRIFQERSQGPHSKNE